MGMSVEIKMKHDEDYFFKVEYINDGMKLPQLRVGYMGNDTDYLIKDFI